MKTTSILCAAVILLFAGFAAASAQDVRPGICPTSTDNSYRGVSLGRSGLDDGFSPFRADRPVSSVPQYFPVMLNATSLGVGAVGDIPVYKNYIVRASFLNLNSPGLISSNLQDIIVPIEFGIRVPIINSHLGNLSYTLYGETTAGLLLGWAFPIDGAFLGYSVPNSRFTAGASAYLGLGNSLRVDRYAGVYLNGGVGYFDLFSSTFLPQNNFFVPSVSVGFYFSLPE